MGRPYCIPRRLIETHNRRWRRRQRFYARKADVNREKFIQSIPEGWARFHAAIEFVFWKNFLGEEIYNRYWGRR